MHKDNDLTERKTRIMEKLFLPGKNGYDIPVLLEADPAAKTAVIVVHGFSSDKSGVTAQRMRDALSSRGAALAAFDLPAHGESPVDGHQLTVENAVNDLAAVEELLHQRLPRVRVAFFASSFGAYLTSLYLARRPRQLTPPRAVLRCAALTMPALLWAELGALRQSKIEQGQVVYLDRYDPPFMISPEFIRSLKANDPFACCRHDMADLLLIHGTADELAPLAEARRFSRRFDFPLIEIEGADHRFQGEGQMERLIGIALDHLCRP